MKTLNPAPARSGSVARRISTTGGLTLAAVLLGICSVMSVIATDRSRERIVENAANSAQAIAEAAGAFDMTARMTVEKLYGGFAAEFQGEFTLNDAGELKHWGELLNGNTTTVDRFHQQTGGVATVFAKKGDDFVRVTTSLKRENGERAVGTLLGKAHPAHARVSAGQGYTGPATLFGKPYMTRYEPVKDAQGAIVGILFIGLDMGPHHAALTRLAANAKLYDTGGIYLVDARSGAADAVVAVHPSAAGRKLAELAPGSEATFAALLDPATRGRVATPGVLHAAHDDAWAVARRVEGSPYWAVAEVSDRQAMRTHWATLVPFWVLLGGATVGLSLALHLVMRRWVATPLAALQQAVAEVADGRLTHPVASERRDELGELMRGVERMRLQLLASLQTVRESADSIRVAATEVATGNQDLSGRTEQTASNLQQAASSLEQLTGTVGTTADSARTANQLAASAADVAQRGGAVVSQVVSTMDEIHGASRKIADIIAVIDGIAFQTNILALNAAVEAARAGEQGRGFAVVAGEVRSLAQRSAEAAREIKGLIQASVEKVDAGSRLVADAGTTMNEIVASVQRVSDIIGEISAAASEQSSGIAQVNGAVTDLDRMTQQNAALVEQSAAAAESLKDQAQKLAEVVGRFELGGAAHAAAPAVSPASAPAQGQPARIAKQVLAQVSTRGPATPPPASTGRPPTATPLPTLTAAVAVPAAVATAATATTSAPAATAPAATQDDDWTTF
ncbi:MAG: Cache 3/Cache 2 fusion domain-containing protein [Rubrivivax sp.]|nr:Cache 3/Cache 2 fusion domain-containing protein [Rubrivivax sp.]